MTIDEQIKHLNETVCATLQPSAIHGIGVYAIRNIKKGERINTPGIEWYTIPPERFGEIAVRIRSLILDRWPQVEGGRPFKSPNDDQNLISFMNHGVPPNTCEGIALRDIMIFEELTEDYDTGNLSEIQKQHYSFI